MLDNYIFIFLNITWIFILVTMIKMISFKNKDQLQWTASIVIVLAFMWCSGMLAQVYVYHIFKRAFMFLLYYYCFGLYFLPSFLLVFVVLYIKPKTKIYSKFLLIFIVPVIFYVLLLTNEYHHLLYIKYAIDERVVFGKCAGLINLYAYTIYLIIIGYLIYRLRNNFKLLSQQSLVIILGLTIPFAANFIVTFKLIQLPLYTNATSMCFSLLIIFYGVIKYRFLEMNPISQKILMDSISDSFVVIDNHFKVTGYNKAFEQQFSVPKTKKGFNFFNIFNQNEFGNDINQAINGKNKVVLEKRITNKSIDQYFMIDIIPIISNNYTIGTIVLFKDVTELNQKNLQLQHLFDQLKQHAATIEELAVVKERNRMASEVHDTLGHTMTSIKALLDLSLVELNDGNLDKVEKAIRDAREFSMESMREIRCSILDLSSFGLESNSMIDAVKSLIIKFESLGIHIDFSVDEPEQYRKNINFSVTVYRLCQEALTNSVKHGKAKNISIIIRTLNELARISIMDDGCGCQNIHKGFGLSGMEQRVKNLNGEIMFGSDGIKGFYIHVEIPIRELI